MQRFLRYCTIFVALVHSTPIWYQNFYYQNLFKAQNHFYTIKKVISVCNFYFRVLCLFLVLNKSVLFLKSKKSRSTIYEKCMFNEILSLVEYLITSSIWPRSNSIRFLLFWLFKRIVVGIQNHIEIMCLTNWNQIN